jgi:hypothetical protein
MEDSPLARLDIGQWAWEFLRRNPEYQTDYREFIAIWQALEQDYGMPPERDFFRWKQDPRASRPAWDPSRSTGAACTTDDEERQLIECWMGAKWGFYQFPQNPARHALELTAPINWRPPPAFDFRSEEQSPSRQRLIFDLSLPLPPQLEAARQWLLSEQVKLRRQRQPAPRTLENQRDHWAELIAALDLADSSHPLWTEAAHMIQHGYREILHLRRNEGSGS